MARFSAPSGPPLWPMEDPRYRSLRPPPYPPQFPNSLVAVAETLRWT